ncbi:MAG: TetR/AcrR family transcriptional regulator [Hyphomicrobiales bacterium]|nr:TetR/AcrR family transcriptional regulator [Hyphomicrobiales bacterium]
MRTQGADAVTMRLIAKECGTTAMAIYHHVPDKTALVTLAVDSLFLKVAETPRRGRTWRTKLVRLWTDIRASLLETPGAGEIFIRAPVVGPGTAKTTDEMFGWLEEGGLRGPAVAEAADALTMLTIGSIANELTRPKQVRDGLGAQLPQSETPHIRTYLRHYSDRDGARRYLAAMNWLLDGIEPAR